MYYWLANAGEGNQADLAKGLERRQYFGRKSYFSKNSILMELSRQFEKAVEDGKSLPEKPSNETLLLLYSLYKQSTQGDNTNQVPAPYDFVAKAKFEAWMSLKGKTKQEAMEEYIKLVEKLKS